MRTIGIDLGKVNSQLSERDGKGVEVRNERFALTREELTRRFRRKARCRVLVEAGTPAAWVSRLLTDLGHEVVVADPNFLPMYVDAASKRKKTDRRDASMLSQALYTGNWRAAHVHSEAEQVRKQAVDLRSRFVAQRTKHIVAVRSTFLGAGVPLKSCAANDAGTQVLEAAKALPEAVRALVEIEAAAIHQLDEHIAALDKRIATEAKSDPRIKVLATAPGVGPIMAAALVATIDTPARFANGHELGSFLGLVPTESSSGERRLLGHISKAGPKYLRSLLVQAAWAIWRSRRDPDSARLREWAQRIATRRSKQVAVTALARKLAGTRLAMWKRMSAFDPKWRIDLAPSRA